jgi:hypothetical protein
VVAVWPTLAPTIILIFRIDLMTANSACLAESVAIDKLPVPTMPNHNNTTDNTLRRHQQHQQQQHQQPLTNNLSKVVDDVVAAAAHPEAADVLTMRPLTWT